MIGGVIWGKVSVIEADKAYKRVISCKILKITQNYLTFNYFIIIWFTFSSFQGPQI